ncbi:MAG: DUF4150 domain-containing protein [Marinicaulis sp.]|nr:DUF4150 domain-containing protein [Marinicaulis sp.]
MECPPLASLREAMSFRLRYALFWIVVAAIGAVYVSPAHAHGGPHDGAVEDPLNGAVLTIEFENVRVPDLPEKFCTQEARNKVREQLEGAKREAEGNYSEALVLVQMLETELPELRRSARRTVKAGDAAANSGDMSAVAFHRKELNAYENARTKIYTSMGEMEAEAIHFTVTIERIETALLRLVTIPLVDCAAEKQNALHRARSDAPRFAAGATGGYTIDKGFDGSEAKRALSSTMRGIDRTPREFKSKPSGGGAVFANGRDISSKSSDACIIAAFSDVCIEPAAPAGLIPVPYPNVAAASDTGRGTRQIKISDSDVMTKTNSALGPLGDGSSSPETVSKDRSPTSPDTMIRFPDVKGETKTTARIDSPAGKPTSPFKVHTINLRFEKPYSSPAASTPAKSGKMTEIPPPLVISDG